MEKTIQENRENTTLERQGNCQFYDATMYDVSFNNASKWIEISFYREKDYGANK